MDKRKYRNGLIFGIIGALLTMLGDFLIGANPAAEISTGVAMIDMFADGMNNSDLRMVLGGLLGAIGIPITGIGYYRIYKAFIEKERGVMPLLYKVAILAYVGLAGAGVHLNCAAIPLLYKWVAATDPALAAQVAEKYANYFMMPPAVIFGVLLFIALVYQMVLFGRGKTPYPKWTLIFNMAFGVIPPYLIAAIIGNNVVGNGIGTAAISIGHLYMFTMFFLHIPDEYKNK